MKLSKPNARTTARISGKMSSPRAPACRAATEAAAVARAVDRDGPKAQRLQHVRIPVARQAGYRLIARQALDRRPGDDPVLGEPALSHLERVLRRTLRPVRVVGLWLHVFDIENLAVGADERDRQRDISIPHPESERLGALEDEQHPVVRLQAEAVHETGLALRRCRGQFGRQLGRADVQRRRRQFNGMGAAAAPQRRACKGRDQKMSHGRQSFRVRARAALIQEPQVKLTVEMPPMPQASDLANARGMARSCRPRRPRARIARNPAATTPFRAWSETDPAVSSVTLGVTRLDAEPRR